MLSFPKLIRCRTQLRRRNKLQRVILEVSWCLKLQKRQSNLFKLGQDPPRRAGSARSSKSLGPGFRSGAVENCRAAVSAVEPERHAFRRNALQLNIWRGELLRAFVWFGVAGTLAS